MGNSESIEGAFCRDGEMYHHGVDGAAPQNAQPAPKKHLVISSRGYLGMIQIESHHSCTDLRDLISEEFDEDMLPHQGEDYYFEVDAVRLSRKQERRTLASHLVGRSILLKVQERATDHGEYAERPTKKCRVVPQSAFPVTSMMRDNERRIVNETKITAGDHVKSFEKSSDALCDDAARNLDSGEVSISHHDEEESRVAPSLTRIDTVMKVDPNSSIGPNDGLGSVRDPDPVQLAGGSMKNEGDLHQIDTETVGPLHRHSIQNLALKKSREVLRQVDQLLKSNPNFCGPERKEEWDQTISELLQGSPKPTIVGVLGTTGAGKSSLLNALVDEAEVLPTSGSRGCTAVVVELRFNEGLRWQHGESHEKLIPVYQGRVEFLTHGEWVHELEILVDECVNHHDQTIYARIPSNQLDSSAGPAWSKINQVYGDGTMESLQGMLKEEAYAKLLNDKRVTTLLTATSDNSYNHVDIKEGRVDAKDAAYLVSNSLPGPLRGKKARWAKNFRDTINDYVYRKGDGNEPQTWPLIRKVVLEGPWNVLSTGACLVDLPGVGDANTARAKVAEHYLANCNEIWIVASIKRAVDDRTAKDLLGEQFKRQLLMDGAYGNVTFICTQTDDCEATETIRDHKDVARDMQCLPDITRLTEQLVSIEKRKKELKQQEKEMKSHLKAAQAIVQLRNKEFKNVNLQISDACSVSAAEQAIAAIKDASKAEHEALTDLEMLRRDHQDTLAKFGIESQSVQRQLKSICAKVRNEYSKSRLQEDFRAGLDELIRNDEEEEGYEPSEAQPSIILSNYEMKVFCTSANDYLKLQGIKPSSDGPPSTFCQPNDTQIPSMRAFVHKTTLKHVTVFTEDFVNGVTDLLDRVRLVATDIHTLRGRRMSRKCKLLFEKEAIGLANQLQPMTQIVRDRMEKMIQTSLQPSVAAGAAKGVSASSHIAYSWGSNNRRTATHRSPMNNGLHYATYLATCKRFGKFKSRSLGKIDMNQELYDPMEKRFSRTWLETMDIMVLELLNTCETQVLQACLATDKILASGFVNAGMTPDRATEMVNAANRSYTSDVRACFRQLKTDSTIKQRALSRSVLPVIKKCMKPCYTATLGVRRGNGSHARMKEAMDGQISRVARSMFVQSRKVLLTGVHGLITDVSTSTSGLSERIASKMKDVYSVCWDSHFDDTDLVLESREKLLPDIQRLCREQESVADKLDIERHEIQFDAAVATNHQDGLKEAGDSDVAEDDEGKCNGDGQQNSDAEEGVPGEVSNSSKVAVAAAGKDDGVISRNERDDDDRSHNSPSHKYNQNDDGNEKDGNVKTSNDDDDHNHRHSDLNHRQSGRIDIESLLRDEDGVESNDDDDGDEDGDRKHNNPSHLYTHNDDDTNENENSVKVKANDGDGDDDDHSHNRNVEDDDCDEDTADDCGLVPMHVTS